MIRIRLLKASKIYLQNLFFTNIANLIVTSSKMPFLHKDNV